MLLPALIENAIARHAASCAVEGEHGALSYRDLDVASARIAAALQSAGVRPGQVVPVLMGRSPAFVVAVLALVRCGAAYAPIDLSSPPARRAEMLAVLDGAVLLVDAAFDRAGLDGRAALCIDELLRTAPPAPRPLPWPATAADAPLYAMFTSGSTGAPKAVLIPHRAVVRLVCDADFADMRRDARWALMSSLAFDASTLELWAPLLNGGCCVVQQRAHPSLDDLAAFLRGRRISDAWLTSALFNAMVDDRPDALGGLRQLLTGGERVSAAHARICLAAWPRLRLINGYGPTENTTFSLCHTITPLEVADAAAQVPIGRPIRGTIARVADAEGSALPTGASGELWVAGDGLAIGYLNDDALTDSRFVMGDGQRWYRTGDQVRCRADGVHEFLGRTDRQVKIAGNRIELDAVERALAGCPGVGDAAVLVQGDQAHTRHLVGIYAGHGGAAPDQSTVADWLAQRLPAAAMPQRLQPMARLPLNLNGKVDRQALAAQLASADAANDRGSHAHDTLTDIERQLADIWARSLPAARLSRDSHFMRCGGGSLLALRVAADIGRTFGRQIDPLDVLRTPVLADQARLVQGARAVGPQELARPSGASLVQLSPSAQALVRASALDASGAAYLVHVALHIPTNVTPRALRNAFQALAQRHPILRTTAALQGERVEASLLPQLPANWWTNRQWAEALPEDGRWPSALTPIVNRPLDLARDGAMRVDCWALPDASTLCVWTLHHFAIDEAAIDHALVELDSLLRGEPLAPTYGSPFAFAALEHGACDEAGIHEQAMHLAQAWADQTPPLPRPPGPGADVDLALPDDTAARLAHACQEWDCTPFTPLLVACALAQQQLYGPAWRFVLTPFSRRGEPELVEPIGYLVDMRLIEAGAREGEAVADTLQRVHAQVLQAQQPRFRPLERLAGAIDAAAPGRSVALTQFALTWRHEPLRTRSLGGATAHMLRVPQAGARFGQVLHLENTTQGLGARLEVMAQGLHDGSIGAFGEAFVAQLQRVCAVQRALPPAQSQPAPHRTASTPHVSSEVPRALARQAWQRWLGRAPESDDTHFLRSGGSSLLAMRLAATLRRDAGLALDVGAFLARPTFGALCGLLGAARTDSDIVTLIGPRNAPRVLLVVPGMRVGALGMFALAQELQTRLGDGCAVAIADTDALMRRAPQQHRMHYVGQQLQQVVRDLGQGRIAGVVGYSAGGVLGIELLQRMGPAWAARVPLWLLDTYAPNHMRPTKAMRARHALVALVSHPVSLARLVALRRRERKAAALRAQTAAEPGLEPGWRTLMDDLADIVLDPAGVHAVLIHSSRAARTAGVWRHRRSNGFDPAHFGSLHVIARDCEHGDLRGAAVAWVAELVATHDTPASQQA